ISDVTARVPLAAIKITNFDVDFRHALTGVVDDCTDSSLPTEGHIIAHQAGMLTTLFDPIVGAQRVRFSERHAELELAESVGLGIRFFRNAPYASSTEHDRHCETDSTHDCVSPRSLTSARSGGPDRRAPCCCKACDGKDR